MSDRPHRGLGIAAFLCIGLISIPVVTAFTSGSEHAWLLFGFACATLLVLIGGTTYLAHAGIASAIPASRFHWQGLLLLALLTIPWGMVIVYSSHASYFLFIMFALAQWICPPLVGILVAIALTVFTIGGQVIYHGLSAGALIGPIVALIFAIIMLQGYRRILSESREKTLLMERLQVAQDALVTSERESSRLAERTRLGRELHDTVAQSLSSIQLLLHGAEKAPPAERATLIAQARQSAAQSLAETRSFISDLTPPDLAGRDLVAALERVAQRARSRGINTQLEVTGVPDRLAMPVETTVLRIVQEAIENALKHGNPSGITIHLEYDDDLTCSIDDDGKGFDVDQWWEHPDPGHVGIASIISRAREIGGHAVVVSSVGDGTLVKVTIPGGAS